MKHKVGQEIHTHHYSDKMKQTSNSEHLRKMKTHELMAKVDSTRDDVVR